MSESRRRRSPASAPLSSKDPQSGPVPRRQAPSRRLRSRAHAGRTQSPGPRCSRPPPDAQPQIPQQWPPPDAESQVPQQDDPKGLQSRAAGRGHRHDRLHVGRAVLTSSPTSPSAPCTSASFRPRRAMSELGLAEMTSAEQTWYTILCILCGAGYFAKLPTMKAISETPPFVVSGQGLTSAGRFWYLLGCLAYGANYFAKVSAKKALSDFGPGPVERHRGRLVHDLVHRLRSRLLRQGPGGQGRQRDAAVPVDRPRLRSPARAFATRQRTRPNRYTCGAQSARTARRLSSDGRATHS